MLFLNTYKKQKFYQRKHYSNIRCNFYLKKRKSKSNSNSVRGAHSSQRCWKRNSCHRWRTFTECNFRSVLWLMWLHR